MAKTAGVALLAEVGSASSMWPARLRKKQLEGERGPWVDHEKPMRHEAVEASRVDQEGPQVFGSFRWQRGHLDDALGHGSWFPVERVDGEGDLVRMAWMGP